MLGSFTNRKQIGVFGAQLPLAGFRNGLIFRPLTDRPTPDPARTLAIENTSQIGVGSQAQGSFCLSLRDAHFAQSRLLDDIVKLSSRCGAYRSSPMDTFGERVKRAMALRNVTVPELMARTGMSRSNVYFWRGNTARPDKVRADNVTAVCRALRINRDWLLHGVGPIEGNETAPTEPDWDDVKGYAQAVGLGKGAEAQEYAETHKLKFRAESLQRKRLNPEVLAVMYGQGDSMLPRIHAGDAILFDQSDQQPRDGGLYVVLWKGEYYVKRAAVFDEDVFFVADHPEGDHHWRRPKRMLGRDPITVIGRVRWIGSWED